MAGQSTSATQVPLFCSGPRSHSAYLISTAARKGGPSVKTRLKKSSTYGASRFRTSPWRSRTIDGIGYFAKVDVEDGLFKPTSENVPSKTDDMLSSDEGVHRVVE